jgi:hypothetical protein
VEATSGLRGAGTRLVAEAVPLWYRPGVDVNVKSIEPDVVARLAEQAAAEGMSQQEWLRQVLRRTAARFSPAELLAQRESSDPMSDADFARLRKKAAARHKAAAERLGATGRRR